ncbi:hypothetical protein JCM10207_007562 [Rhodosporidiobolus poonsookiae]
MSDDSFAALDAILKQECDVVTSLSEENARLRSLLAERDAPSLPSNVSAAQLDPATLYAELQATKAAQAELFAELKSMRESQVAAAAEDRSDEVALLRSSLADLANQLEAEKTRVTALEVQRKEEEEKVTTLRSKVEESRRALMRLQNESNKRSSIAGMDNYSFPPSSKRAITNGNDQGYSFPPRRGSLLDSAPRRRSSLGLAAITGSPSSPDSPTEPIPLSGLGLAVQSPTAATFQLSSSPSSTSKATPLQRYAHRRGSASISIVPSGSSEEDDRTARLRELRLGMTSTKCHSRRNSAVTGLPEFATPFDWDAERRFARRMSAASSSRSRRNGSICEGDETDSGSSSYDAPLSANLRMVGRQNSFAVFQSWSRRSSSTSDSFSTGGCGDAYNPEPVTQDHLRDLQLQLQGLRIQLAEAEEGRRASELCLRALKEFVSKANPDADGLPLSLPPLPSDSTADALGDDTSSPRRPTAPSLPSASRWSIPRLSLSNRTPQANSDAASFRRSSAASSVTSASGTCMDSKPTPSLPSFGAFSFSALVSRPTSVFLVDADTSPTMSRPATFAANPLTATCGAGEFPVEPSPLLGSGSNPTSRAASVRRAQRSSQDSVASPSDAEGDDAASTAPSLVSDSDLSSRGSSRASSPELEAVGQMDGIGLGLRVSGGVDSPRVVIDFAEEQDQLVEAARMPAAMGKLTTLASARAGALAA